MLHAGVIDQDITAAVHILHGDRGRDVVDNLLQEFPIAIALVLQPLPFGHIFHDADQEPRLAVCVANGVTLRCHQALVPGKDQARVRLAHHRLAGPQGFDIGVVDHLGFTVGE